MVQLKLAIQEKFIGIKINPYAIFRISPNAKKKWSETKI